MTEHQQCEYKQIRVYTDKIRIWNPGQLPDDWTLDKLLGRHSSQPFNPDVANTFFRAGMIEAWGQGIEKIFAACAAGEVPAPKIECDHSDMWVEFPFATPAIERGAKGGPMGGAIGGAIDLTERQSEIIERIRVNPQITYRKIAELLEINDSAVITHIRKLKQKGVLKRVGGTRGHWEVLQ
jgi:ATP-dependent DNA helicase RecG